MVEKKEIDKFEKMLKKIKVDKKEKKKIIKRPTERSIDHFGLKRVGDNYETDVVYVIKKNKKGKIESEFKRK